MSESEKIDANSPEVILVAGALIAPALAAEAARYVIPEDFEDARLRMIWSTLTKMIDAGMPPDQIDILTVSSRCAKSSVTQRKVAIYCSTLLDVFPKISSLVTAAQRVHKRRTMRVALEEMRVIATEIKEQLEAPGGEVEHLEDRIAQMSIGVSSRSDTTLNRVEYSDVASQVTQYFDQLATGPSPSTIPTGIDSLDLRLGGGVRLGQLHTILGCTGSGKTALASQLCDNASIVGQRALMFSMEVDPLDIYIRDVERKAGRSRWDLRSHSIAIREAAQNALVAAQSSWISSHSGKIVYGEPMSVEGIRQIVLTERLRSGPIGIVVVDHAQVAEPSSKDKRSMPRYLEVKATAEGLRALARQLNVAVVLTAQLNPPPKGEKPTMSLVRESKDINNTSEVVLVIWHEKEETADGDIHLMNSWIIAEKVRAGQEGKVRVRYDGSFYRFTDYFQHHHGGQANESSD